MARYPRSFAVVCLALGLIVGALAPAVTSAQSVVRLYGTLAGAAQTPIALIADTDGYLQVVCTNIP